MSDFSTVPTYSLAKSSRLLLRSSELVASGMSPKHKTREKRLRQQTNVVTYYREVHAIDVVSCGHSPVAAKQPPSALQTFLESRSQDPFLPPASEPPFSQKFVFLELKAGVTCSRTWIFLVAIVWIRQVKSITLREKIYGGILTLAAPNLLSEAF